MKILKISSYVIYNTIVVYVLIQIISFLNTYVNALFIPDFFRWTNEGTLRSGLELFAISQFIIANIESILFLYLVFLLNSKVTKHFPKLKNSVPVSIYTFAITEVIMVVLIFRYFYYIYI